MSKDLENTLIKEIKTNRKLTTVVLIHLTLISAWMICASVYIYKQSEAINAMNEDIYFLYNKTTQVSCNNKIIINKINTIEKHIREEKK